MRKIVLSIAGVAATLAAAAPATAQYYGGPPPAPYGYNGYNNGYNNGYRGDWGQVRELRERIYRVRQQIERLNHRDALGYHTSDRLVHEANELDRRLADKQRGGLSPREAGDIQYRLQRLEQQVQFALGDHHPRWSERY